MALGLPEKPRDQVMIVLCVVFLGLVGVYYMYFWSDKQSALAVIQTHVDTLLVHNEEAKRETAKGSATKLKAEAEEYGKMLAIMRQLVPTANEVPTLMDQISTAARQTGLEIGDFAPMDKTTGELFDTYKYKMAVTGSYHRIARLLDNVGSLTRIVAPMNLSLTPTSKDLKTRRPGPDESVLDATFEVQTYVAKSSAPAPTAAPRGQ